jgi:vitamin B12 transporter
MKDNRFALKHFLLKGASAALLLCGGASQVSAQTVATLDEVVVTATRAEESRREVTSNVTVIGETEIAASTASNLADLMVEQGFMVVTSGDASHVQIRGYGSLTLATEPANTVLTLINGRRVNNPNLAIVGLANVERIEIIRGPAAVQYGPSAMGGVINIITKQGRGVDKPYLSAEAGIGSDAMHREKISFGGAGGGFDFAVGLTNYGRDDVTVSEGRRWYGTEIMRNTLLNTDIGYTIADNHRAGFNFNYGNINSKLPGSGFRGSNSPDVQPTEYTKSNQNFAFNYAGHSGGKAFNWQATYAFGDDDRERTPYGGTAVLTTVESRTFNAQAGFTASLVSLSTGIDYLKYYEPANGNNQQDTGVYFTGKLRLIDERLIFSAGGRYDSYSNETAALDRNYGNFGGSVGAAYLPANWLKLRVNYAEGFKVPTVGNMFGSPPWYAPNFDLRPEKSKTVEFGTDISSNFIDVGLTYFHSEYKDKIVNLAVSGLEYPYQARNLESSTLAGLESSFRTDIGKAFRQDYGLTPYVSFTWLGTRRNGDESQYITFNGNRIDILPNTPELMISYGLDYNNPALKLKTRLSANRYGTLYTSNWDVAPYGYIERQAGTVVNLSAERELARFGDNGGALNLRAEIENLFDGKNEMYWSYPGAGRSFYVGLRYGF